MKLRTYLFLLLSMMVTTGFAQTRLWITGSAVPGGTQELTKFPVSGSTSSCFKFHGRLLPGDLYIITTEEEKASTYYYAPKLVDSNIVNEGIAWKKTRTKEGSQWAVLFEADNYRFTITTATGGTVAGELFPWWYEAWIVGGCVADNQGVKEGEPGHWQISAGKEMVRSSINPYEWVWLGELKSYNNDEPKRFKINGQYGWGPKVLHPFKQDESILKSSQVCYGGADNKWSIENDGYYLIVTNVFTETIHGEYAQDEETFLSGASSRNDEADGITVNGREVRVSSDVMLTASLIAADGMRVDMQNGTQITLSAPAQGVYIVLLEGEGGRRITRKVAIN